MNFIYKVYEDWCLLKTTYPRIEKAELVSEGKYQITIRNGEGSLRYKKRLNRYTDEFGYTQEEAWANWRKQKTHERCILIGKLDAVEKLLAMEMPVRETT